MEKSIRIEINDGEFIAMLNRMIRIRRRDLIGFGVFEGYLLALNNIGLISTQLMSSLIADDLAGHLDEVKLEG